MPEQTIGEPIPKGFIDRTGVHAAQIPNEEPTDISAVLAKLDTLRAELAALRNEVTLVGKRIGRVAQEHPIAAAFVVSVGLCAILGWGYRRTIYMR